MDHKLAVVMASLMPFDTLVKKLQSEIEEYKSIPTEENKDSVVALASMILMNHMADGSVEGAIKIADRFSRMDRLEQLFNIETN